MFVDFILVTERPLDNPKDEYTGMTLLTMSRLAYVYKIFPVICDYFLVISLLHLKEK